MIQAMESANLTHFFVSSSRESEVEVCYINYTRKTWLNYKEFTAGETKAVQQICQP
jgi:hypothetical protein